MILSFEEIDYSFPADQSRFSSWTVGSLDAVEPVAGDECCRDMLTVHWGDAWEDSSAEPRREDDSPPVGNEGGISRGSIARLRRYSFIESRDPVRLTRDS